MSEDFQNRLFSERDMDQIVTSRCTHLTLEYDADATPRRQLNY